MGLMTVLNVQSISPKVYFLNTSECVILLAVQKILTESQQNSKRKKLSEYFCFCSGLSALIFFSKSKMTTATVAK